MRISLPVIASAVALAAMGAVGAVSGQVEGTDTTPVVEATDVAPVALPKLSFPAGVYMENRISDHVDIPPGATITFRGLPPGLTYDPATTAIKGVPTTPGVYNPVATAGIGGIPMRTETTTVTITGNGGGGNGGGGNSEPAPADRPAPAPAPAPADRQSPAPAPERGQDRAPAPVEAPAPGTINIEDIENLNLPPEVKDALRNAALAINDGIQNAWNEVPEGSLGK